MNAVKIIPLGGVREFGLNSTVLETGQGAILIDAGLMFPRYNITGIDQIIPEFSYVIDNADRFKGIFLTHGHEDHIGALPHLLKQVKLPIYGHPFTLELLKRKLQEYEINGSLKFHPLEAGRPVKLGDFSIEPIEVDHSTTGCFAFAIDSPQGLIVHSGDFRLMPERFTSLGEGARLVLCESTNAEIEPKNLSEDDILANIETIVADTGGVVLVSTFSSHVRRIQALYEIGVRAGRKVAIIGRSMNQVVDIASDIGMIRIDKKHLINPEALNSYARDEIMIICTGTQGEMYSVLSLIARGWHDFKVDRGDSVIISARIIPGNETAIARCIDQLIDFGAEVFYPGTADVHATGHATHGEIEKTLRVLKPQILMPVHGELRHMKALADMARRHVADLQQTVFARTGEVWTLDEHGIANTAEVVHGKCFVDGNLTGDIRDSVLKERRNISEGGMVVVFVVIDTKTGDIVLGPDILCTGVVPGTAQQNLIDELGETALDTLNQYMYKNCDIAQLEDRLRENLSRCLKSRLGKKSVLKPVIMEI